MPASRQQKPSRGSQVAVDPRDDLVGRDVDLQELTGFLERVAGSGEALLLSGDPGVGKTALLNAAQAMAADADMTVLRAGGVEFEADLAYSTLHQALAPLGVIRALPPAQQRALAVARGLGVGPPPSRLLVSAATLEAIVRESRRRPVVVMVDDLPWVDGPSLSVFAFIARRIAGNRVGFLATSRTEAQDFFDRSGVAVRPVVPLEPAPARELLARCFPSMTCPIASRVLAEARGNPLALLELPSSLTSVAESASLPVASRLQGHFTRVIERVPIDARPTLLMAALHAEGTLAALRSGSNDPIAMLEPAARLGLLSLNEQDFTFEFRHPLIRSAVVALATVAERRRAHSSIAARLGNDPDRQVWHLAEAALGPDARVAEELEHAAHRILLRGDTVGGVSALSRAGMLSSDPHERSRRIAEAAYIGADVNGDLSRVANLLENVRNTDPDAQRSLETAVAAAYTVLNGDGAIVTAHRLLVGTLETSERRSDVNDPIVIEALFVLFSVCLWAEQPQLWQDFDAALARLEGIPSLLRLSNATLGDPPRTTAASLAELDAQIATLPTETDVVKIERVARAGTYLDRVPACRDSLERVVGDGRRGGAISTAMNAMMHLCVDDWFIGRWDEAIALSDEGWLLGESRGYDLPRWAFRYGAALVAASRGEHETAIEIADAIYAWSASRGAGGAVSFAHHIRMIDALTRGDHEDALRHAERISPLGVLPPHVGHPLWIALGAIESAEYAGYRERARAHVGALRSAHVDRISPRLAMIVEAAEGLVTDGPASLGHFDAATRVAGTERWPFEKGRVHLAYGRRLRREHQVADAREQLEVALETFRGLRANTWAAQAANELRASGVAVQTSRGATVLTRQEREVADLAARGLSNKEIAQRLFISPRTAAAHLYRIYPKLGIRSRAALRDALNS